MDRRQTDRRVIVVQSQVDQFTGLLILVLGFDCLLGSAISKAELPATDVTTSNIDRWEKKSRLAAT